MKAGFVSLVGLPNAGKSTLLNRLVGTKLAIVSDKPQTTRNRILGVRNYEHEDHKGHERHEERKQHEEHKGHKEHKEHKEHKGRHQEPPSGLRGQIVFVDTPGIHKPTHRMNVRMVNVALDAMREVDVVGVVLDASQRPGGGQQHLFSLVRGITVPVVLILNKVDLVAKPKLLPVIDRVRQEREFAAIVPVSATTGDGVDRLEQVLLDARPEGEPLYPPDFLTDQPERFFVAEIVREQVLRHTHAELPFSSAVIVDRFEEPDERGLLRLYCTILVERASQKPIILGRGGQMIKTIGTAARLELEKFFDTRVFLDLHVKVRGEWREDERTLDELLTRRGE